MNILVLVNESFVHQPYGGFGCHECNYEAPYRVVRSWKAMKRALKRHARKNPAPRGDYSTAKIDRLRGFVIEAPSLPVPLYWTLGEALARPSHPSDLLGGVEAWEVRQPR
jgi:hypothetical protein